MCHARRREHGERLRVADEQTWFQGDWDHGEITAAWLMAIEGEMVIDGSSSGERRQLVLREKQSRCGQVLVEMGHRRRPGNGEHRRRASQKPGDGRLGGRRLTMPRERTELASSARERSGAERIPGDECQPVSRARIDDVVVCAVLEVVTVLD